MSSTVVALRNHGRHTRAGYVLVPTGNLQMGYYPSPYERYVADAVHSGEGFLMAKQWPDGMWRDFELQPGPSEAWTTAFVGMSLATPPSGLSHLPALKAAARSLHFHATPHGWGYNRETGADADSTAWALRYLAAVDGVRSPVASGLLTRYLDEVGAAHTFLTIETDTDSWGDAHPDVTPVVGLALIAIGASKEVVNRLRRAVLAARNPGGTWSAFWWSVNSYSNARCIEFLVASGGVPDDVADAVRDWLNVPSEYVSFDVAQRLSLATVLAGADDALSCCLIEILCEMQLADGSWPPSKVLALPPHDNKSDEVPPTTLDSKRMTSSSAAVDALKRWLVCKTGPATLAGRYTVRSGGFAGDSSFRSWSGEKR